jgi:hypothetical protein
MHAAEKRLFSAVCGGQVGQRPTLVAASVALSLKGMKIPYASSACILCRAPGLTQTRQHDTPSA